MNIRFAREPDLPAINAIYNQAVAQRFCTAHLEPLTLGERRSWFLSHPPDRYPVFVSTVDRELNGWLSLSPYRADRQALAHVCEVSFYVDRDSRQRGIGSHLLQHAVQAAPEFGFSVMVAILLNKNPASIALLDKFGFSLWGTMPGIALIDGEVADHLYMGLKL